MLSCEPLMKDEFFVALYKTESDSTLFGFSAVTDVTNGMN